MRRDLATEDGTIDTDIRTLTDEQLRSLQVEAGAAGDSDLVATINEVLADR